MSTFTTEEEKLEHARESRRKKFIPFFETAQRLNLKLQRVSVHGINIAVLGKEVFQDEAALEKIAASYKEMGFPETKADGYCVRYAAFSLRNHFSGAIGTDHQEKRYSYGTRHTLSYINCTQGVIGVDWTLSDHFSFMEVGIDLPVLFAPTVEELLRMAEEFYGGEWERHTNEYMQYILDTEEINARAQRGEISYEAGNRLHQQLNGESISKFERRSHSRLQNFLHKPRQ